MASVNFGNFVLAVPNTNDYFVGYRNTTEIRTTISSLTALNLPLISSISLLNNNALRYESIYSTFNTNSGSYNSVYSTTQSSSGLWNLGYNYYATTSADFERISFNMDDVIANSANWQGAYFFSLGSATFLDTIVVASAYRAMSASYFAAYTETYNNSGTWLPVYTTVNVNSASWDGGNIAYNYVYNTSGGILELGYNMTDVEINSGNWQGAYFFVKGSDTTPGSATFIENINVSNTFKQTSATFVTYQNLSTASVTISAVTIVQSLSVLGDLIVFANLPTSNTGLPAGAVYNDGGFLKIV